MSLGIKREG